MAYGKRLYYHIMSLRVDILVYKTSLIPPLFNNVPVLSQEHDMCQICFCFYDIPIRFWNGSDGVVCFDFHFTTSNDFTSFCTGLAMWYDLFSALLLQMILRVLYCSGDVV